MPPCPSAVRPRAAALAGALSGTLAAALLTVLLTVLLAACSDKPAPAAAAGPGAGAGPSAPPPLEVGVLTVRPGTVGVMTELPGRTEASRVAQVRARAAGIVQQRLFREGSDVRAGQPLFKIDDAPYRAALASAQAALARADANALQARANAERAKPLYEGQAMSQQDYVAATATRQQTEADVAAAKAAVQTAQINLGYASVTAPIGGRIGRALVTEGALVGQGEATPLAVVQQIDPMYVSFTQPVAEVLRLRAAIAAGQLQRASGAQSATVRLLLDDGSRYALPGRLLFSDLTVDPTSGQITLRAEVPNPQGLLLPGMYVRGRLELAQAGDAILLPQQAVQRGSDGDRVWVVAADGKLSTRTVKLGGARGGDWVVLEGLKAGEQVVMDGFQKLSGRSVVKPVPWQPPGATASASASAPAPAAASAAAPAPAASR
ncbi:MAG: efflux RND transporter periplasmic adaptor subunit [Proteobacteria bacterium]|nr:efflux RND transporter periplasmic adaptor subunit [Pseudomonadota bacterium]